MWYIKARNKPPKALVNWIKHNTLDIQYKLNHPSVSGREVWEWFRNNGPYLEVKKALLEDQGYICCYCGQRIKNDNHTTIEHLLPKKTHKQLTLTYLNLLASCSGNKKNQIHKVKTGETLEDIAQKYGVDSVHLEQVWVNANEIELFRKRYDIEHLEVGDKVVIWSKEPKPKQHCDPHKGNDTIAITPRQKDCFYQFTYHKIKGFILHQTPDAESTIQTLGLNNNRYINRLRVKSIQDVAIPIKRKLIQEAKHNPKQFQQKREQILKHFSETDHQGQFKPFAFIIVKELI